MKPLKVAILWHFHQPYYLKDDEMILPWVRLHGVKDYWDLPELFYEYPNLKQTINLVPSLCMQLEEYVKGGAKDKIQILTEKDAKSLSDEDKKEILRLFFLCNHENMIKPFRRYQELYLAAADTDKALLNFEPQDWLDLQVWYNLTWIGNQSRKRSAVRRLFTKGKNFTEEEKAMVLDLHLEILSKIIKQYKSLISVGQLEISCTPKYHPILPLLCDSQASLEATPNCSMPEKIFKYPEDAKAQLEGSLTYYEDVFNRKADGVWPSEGSISDEVLRMIAALGYKWTASDEAILAASMGDSYSPLAKYFPAQYSTESGDLTVFFRDHNLSDAIGFVYSRWDQKDAANDFCNRLRHIKGEIVENLGEEALDYAVVPVILDGENCWEFYFQNGIYFQRELFNLLNEADDLKTITYSEAAEQNKSRYSPRLKSVKAGSWINGNFKIWIGNKEELAAWNMLAEAREAVEKRKDDIEPENFDKAMEEIYIAEGSDWFWWYGDEHQAENKSDFDVLFREHLQRAYKLIGVETPSHILEPISESYEKKNIVQQRGEVAPIIDGRITDAEKWNDAGFYAAAGSQTAMHQVGEVLHRIWFASTGDELVFRCDTSRQLKNSDRITFQFKEPKKFELVIKSTGFKLLSDEPIESRKMEFAKDEIIEFGFSKAVVQESDKIEFIVKTETEGGEIIYPRQGRIVFDIVN